MDKKFKLFLYAGSSYSTLLRLNRLIPGLLSMNVQPVMIFPEAPQSKNSNAHTPEMQDFAFYDNVLMNEVIIPYMDRQKDPILTNDGQIKKGVCYSPRHLSRIYREAGVQAFTLKDVNAQSHIDLIENTEGLIGGVGDRSLQRFEQPTIDAFAKKRFSAEEGQGKGFLWNLHPGRLPDHRGLLPIFRAADAKLPTFDVTLHGIRDRSIDTGTIYGATPVTIDPSKSLLAQYYDEAHIKSGAALVFKNVADVLRYGEPLDQYPQRKEEGESFSYPSPDEIQSFREEGGIWVDAPKKEWEPLAVAFANGSQHGYGLRAEIVNAVNERSGKPTSRLPSNDVGVRKAPVRFISSRPPEAPEGMRLIA